MAIAVAAADPSAGAVSLGGSCGGPWPALALSEALGSAYAKVGGRTFPGVFYGPVLFFLYLSLPSPPFFFLFRSNSYVALPFAVVPIAFLVLQSGHWGGGWGSRQRVGCGWGGPACAREPSVAAVPCSERSWVSRDPGGASPVCRGKGAGRSLLALFADCSCCSVGAVPSSSLLRPIGARPQSGPFSRRLCFSQSEMLFSIRFVPHIPSPANESPVL